MATRKRGSFSPDPVSADPPADHVLTELTRRVVRVLIAKSHEYLWCNDICDLLGIKNGRRVYDVLEALLSLGCLVKKQVHKYRWRGLPTLSQLPQMPIPKRGITLGMAAQIVVRFFMSNETARSTVWRGITLKQALSWKQRPRVVYDVLCVFRGIGLISHHPAKWKFAFRWSPDAVLPLVTPSTPSPPPLPICVDMGTVVAPPPPLAEIPDDDDGDTRSMNSFVDLEECPLMAPPLEFESLLGEVQIGPWVLNNT